jgi:DNA-binding HxlR family transcriptional regulator
MENDVVQLKQEVEELKKTVSSIQQKLSGRPEAPIDAPPKAKGFTDDMREPAQKIRELLQGEPLILVFNLRAFCVVRGKIWTHETGYSGIASFAQNPTVFCIPSDKVEENRNCPEEIISKYFSIFSGVQRISLMRALLNEEPRTSAELKEETGLTDGQFYHHLRELAAAGCLLKKGHDQYHLSDTGKKLLLFAESIASDIESSALTKPEDIEVL